MVGITAYSLLSSFVILGLFKETFQRHPFYIQISYCEAACPDIQICEANCTVNGNGKFNTVTGFLNLLKTFEKYGIWFEGSLKQRNSPNYLNVLNETLMDVCPLLRDDRRSGLLPLLIQLFQKFGNIPICPVEKDLYYVKDFRMSAEHLPPYVPEGDFKIKGTVFALEDGKQVGLFKYLYSGSVIMERNPFWDGK